MNCENYQELILTDYLDVQLDQKKKQEVERHFLSCSSCRELAENAFQMTVQPFQKAQRSTLSESAVWQKLQERIEQESAASPSSRRVFGWPERIKSIFNLPQPVFAGFALILLVSLALFTGAVRKNQMAKKVTTEEVQSLAYVMDEINVDVDEVNGDYGTSIEDYFL